MGELCVHNTVEREESAVYPLRHLEIGLASQETVLPSRITSN